MFIIIMCKNNGNGKFKLHLHSNGKINKKNTQHNLEKKRYLKINNNKYNKTK